jgi:hypothetical protein
VSTLAALICGRCGATYSDGLRRAGDVCGDVSHANGSEDWDASACPGRLLVTAEALAMLREMASRNPGAAALLRAVSERLGRGA